MPYFVYILECNDKTYYSGIAKDVAKRLHEHNTSPKGAKYTRSRRPVVVKYTEAFETKSEALKREYTIKQLSRSQKAHLFMK